MSVPRVLRAFALGFELRDGAGIVRRLVGVDHLGQFPILQPSQRLSEEPLRRLGVAGRREVEIDRVPELVDRAVQIRPLAADLDVGLVDAPAPRPGPAPLPAQALLHLWGVSLHPAIDRRVVDRHAAFGHHCFEIAVADRVPAVPAHRPEHDLTLEVPSLEIVHAPTPRPSHLTPFTIQGELCNRAVLSPEVKEKAVWVEIDCAFSHPTTLSDDAADYVPTQILAELFRDTGYDGIVYRSHFGE